jgi:hypothetical protein
MGNFQSAPFASVVNRVLKLLDIFSARIDLSSNEPSPEELFGILGITKDVCEGILAFLFVRCTEGGGGGGGEQGMGMGMGKRGRRTTESVVKRELTDAYNRLSTDDKKRVLVAVQDEDQDELASLFGRRRLVVSQEVSDEPSPEELFGILGITKDVCEGILAFLFVRCTEGGGGGGDQGMGMGMGKRGRRTKESVVKRELTDAYNRLSKEDRERVLVAVREEDQIELAKIFSR